LTNHPASPPPAVKRETKEGTMNRIKKGRKKVKLAGGFIVTSLLDVFTIILLYLMKNYSAEGSIITNADNLVLPNSISDKRPTEVSLQISVADDMVMVDNTPCCPTEDIRRIPQSSPDPVIPKLCERLEAKYKQEQEMLRDGSLNKLEGKITIQVDKNMDFDAVYKIMNTCGKVGYNNMNFAVMQREGAEGQ
jgi:biopolymer transport protein ExbD